MKQLNAIPDYPQLKPFTEYCECERCTLYRVGFILIVYRWINHKQIEEMALNRINREWKNENHLNTFKREYEAMWLGKF